MAVCSEIHTKHINALCGQNAEFLEVERGGTSSTGVSELLSSEAGCKVTSNH